MELDAATLNRAVQAIERALGGMPNLTRQELSEHLASAGIAASGQRLAHITLDAELKGVICSGPRRDKQFTYALVSARAPNAVRLERDAALARLAERFFKSHGPATVRDFVWWSGILTPEAKRALEIIRTHRAIVDGQTYYWKGDVDAHPARRRHSAHLLPIYDEYLIAYRDRGAGPHAPATAPRSAFPHPLVIDGRVAGTWRPVRLSTGIRVEISAARRFTADDRRSIEEAAARYAHFLRVPATVALR
jgi:hypothetical protein